MPDLAKNSYHAAKAGTELYRESGRAKERMASFVHDVLPGTIM